MTRSLFIDHAAELLGVSRRTIYYRISEGRLRTVRTIGGTQRVLLESVVALMREDSAPDGHPPARSSAAEWTPERAPARPPVRRLLAG
jgi:excisionase family DNA binding protein